MTMRPVSPSSAGRPIVGGAALMRGPLSFRLKRRW